MTKSIKRLCRVGKEIFQHYANPWHVSCRIVDVCIFFGRPANMREILKTPIMRWYDIAFRAIAY